jgi:hypothetical protein
VCVTFDTRVAIVVLEDLAVWQKLNVTAFLASGIALSAPGLIGEAYADADGLEYLPLLIQPVLIFSATSVELKKAYGRSIERELKIGVYTRQMFTTGHDADNRATVKAVTGANLELVGIGMRGVKGAVDKALKGLTLHK